MKLVHNIKISVFVKGEEDSEKIESVLRGMVPFDLDKEKIVFLKTSASGFDQKKIRIFEVDLVKERHTNTFLNVLKEKLNDSQKEMLVRQKNRLDDECCFFMRLDKEKLLKGEYWVTDSGDCFHIRMNIAAFPKKRENAEKIIEEIFG